MNKKIISALLFFITSILTSCWIYPDYKSYTTIEDVLFFEDYETMKAIIIPKINKSFSAWHWDGKEFDKKYEMYSGNIEGNEDDYKILTEKGYVYAVRNPSSLTAKINGNTKEQRIGECYWITTRENKGVLFYQN